MKLEKWQRDKLRKMLKAWHPEGDTEFMLRRIDALLAEPTSDEVELDAIYKRFMAEWKQVGVWQGGKPVRTKLARLAKSKQLDDVWAGLERLRNDPNRPAPEFVPRPMTWLNQERWNDDPYPAKSSGRQAAAGAVLDIQLDGVQPHISPAGVRELVQRSPSIMSEMQQGRWSV